MRHKIALLFSTAILALSGLTGCNRPRTVIDSSIKGSFQNTKEKVDEYNDVFSESSHVSQQVLQPANAPVIKNALNTDYNTSITEAKLYEFLAAEFFGIYVYSCVNYCLQNKYEEYGLEFDDPIYGNVTNTIDPNGREALKKFNATNRFYFEMAQENNDLLFKCDWDLVPTAKELADNRSFSGIIYVNGRIARDDNLNINSFSLTSFKNSFKGYTSVLTGINFDFVNKKLFVVDANSSDYTDDSSANKEMIEKYNAGELNYEAFKGYKFNRILVGSANLTDDYRDVDYKGYFWNSTAQENDEIILNKKGVNEEIFEEKYNEVYNNLYSFKVRNTGDDLDRNNRIYADFLEDSLAYGVAKSRIYVGASDEVDYVFIEKEKLLQEIEKYIENNEGENTVELLNTLRDQILNIRDVKYLTYFSNNRYEFDANVASYYRHTTYNCTDFYYTFRDKNTNNKLIIRTQNGELTGVTLEKPHDQGLYEKYAEPYTTRTETILTYREDENGSLVLLEKINSYTRCREEDCKEEYIWKAIENTYLATLDKNNPAFKYATEYNVKNVKFYGFKTNTKTYRYNYEQLTLVNVIKENFKYEYNDKYGVYIPTSTLRRSIDAIYFGGTDHERLNIDGTYDIEINEEGDTTTIKCSYEPYIDEVMWREEFEFSSKSIDATMVVKRNDRYNYDISVSFESVGGTTSPYDEQYLVTTNASITSHLEYTDFDIPDRHYPYVSRLIYDVAYSSGTQRRRSISRNQTGDLTVTYSHSDEWGDYYLCTAPSFSTINKQTHTYEENPYLTIFNFTDKKDMLYVPLLTAGFSGCAEEVQFEVWSDYSFVGALLEGVIKSYVENDMIENEEPSEEIATL